jgi:hypothetical protein
MPYITPDKRPAVDAVLQPLIEHIKALPMEEQDGTINYAVTKLLNQVYPHKYFHFNRALGVLSAITHEFYRRAVAPYEDTKIKENGDV